MLFVLSWKYQHHIILCACVCVWGGRFQLIRVLPPAAGVSILLGLPSSLCGFVSFLILLRQGIAATAPAVAFLASHFPGKKLAHCQHRSDEYVCNFYCSSSFLCIQVPNASYAVYQHVFTLQSGSERRRRLRGRRRWRWRRRQQRRRRFVVSFANPPGRQRHYHLFRDRTPNGHSRSRLPLESSRRLPQERRKGISTFKLPDWARPEVSPQPRSMKTARFIRSAFPNSVLGICSVGKITESSLARSSNSLSRNLIGWETIQSFFFYYIKF